MSENLKLELDKTQYIEEINVELLIDEDDRQQEEILETVRSSRLPSQLINRFMIEAGKK